MVRRKCVCMSECVYVCNVCYIERDRRERRAKHEQLVVTLKTGTPCTVSELFCMFKTISE